MMNLLLHNPIVLCCNPLPVESSLWQKIVESLATSLPVLVGILFAAFLAYRYAIKQKRKETFIELEKIKYERKLTALEDCWKLLAYTTDTENEKSIIKWELQNKEKTFFFRTGNAQAFIKNLPELFYDKSLGVYLSSEIKEKIFEYRSIIFGFLLREKNNYSGSIFIQNTEMVKKMIEIHQTLVQQIRKETEKVDKIEK